jgi:hypothetical protein
VVVLGGPPCTAYCNCRSDVSKAKETLKGVNPGDALTPEQQRAQAKLEAFAREQADADQVVTAFLELFFKIDATCEKLKRPCNIIIGCRMLVGA